MKLITWVDLQGRYRITSPAYGSLMVAHSEYEDHILVYQFTEDDCINWVWTVLVQSGLYGIAFDHPMFLVEIDDLRAKIAEIEGERYRYPPGPNVDQLPGAWEMDVDGTPKVNMVKAQVLGL